MTPEQILEDLYQTSLLMTQICNSDAAEGYAFAAHCVKMSIGRPAVNDRCPNCKRHLRKPVDKMMLNGKRYHRNGDAFCSRCGQAITWEVKDDE